MRGGLFVGDGVSSFFANLQLGLGGLRSTGSAFLGPAVHPSKTPLWLTVPER